MSCADGVITCLKRFNNTKRHNRRKAWWRKAMFGALTGGIITVWVWCSLNLWDANKSDKYISFPYRPYMDKYSTKLPGLSVFFDVRAPPDDTTPGLPHNGTNILILSSSGRSGSSLLADIVTSFDDSFYYFEPMLVVKPNDNSQEETIEELRRVFRCNIRDDLFSTSHGRQTVRYSIEKSCQTGITLGYKVERARHKCRMYSKMIVKTIRTRLEWLTSLMEDTDLQLRVIHLVRDPRPVRMSQKRLWFGRGYTAEACENILKDVQFKEQMQKMYPSRYLFIRYEDLAMDILNKTLDVYKFVSGVPDDASHISSEDLPPCCKQYIAEHTTSTRGGDYSTFRKTNQVIQHWRSVITQQELTETENICRKVLVLLGYNIFTTIEATRNMSVPVLARGSFETDNSKTQAILI